jgi:hypothetical protein
VSDIAPKLFPSPPVWCGWRKTAKTPWAKVCQGATEFDVMRQLLDISAEMGGHGEGIVLPEGRRPDSRKGVRP